MDIIEEKPDKPVKGLVTDFHPLDQPEGTWRSALNVSVSDAEFDGNLVSEASNQFCYNVGAGKIVVGHVEMNNNSVLVCSTDTGMSYLGIATDCVYQEILATQCLGFDPCYPIRGVFKIINGCERIITLYDGKNTDKYINIDRLSDYYTDEEFDCAKAELAFFTRQPILAYDSTLVGGALPLGSYTFYVECLDQDLNRIGLSNELGQFIVVGNVDGGANIEQVPITDGGLPLSNKRFRFSVNNIPENARYIRLYTNVWRTADGTTYETFYVNNLKDVTGTTAFVELSSLSASYVTRADIQPLITPNSFYNKSKNHEIVSGRLVRANLEEKTYDWSLFQREISKSLVNWNVEDVAINNEDPAYYNFSPWGNLPTIPVPTALNQNIYDWFVSISQPTSYLYKHRNNSVSFYTDQTTFMSDEVYSIWVRPVMKSGIVGPQFHVPGRAADMAAVFDVTGGVSTINNSTLITRGNGSAYNRLDCPTGEGWDTYTIVVEDTSLVPIPLGSLTQIDVQETRQFGFVTVTTNIGYGLNADPLKGTVGNGLIPRWLLFNTGVNQEAFYADPMGKGVLAYYQCEDLYPQVESCDGNDYWGEDYWGNELTGTPIRHHRIPDLPVIDKKLWKLYTATQEIEKRKITLTLSNVQFPAQYLADIEYYEIAITKRIPDNSTIVDKGILYHALRYVPDYEDTEGIDAGKFPYYSDAFPLFPAAYNPNPLFPYDTGSYYQLGSGAGDDRYFIPEGKDILIAEAPRIDKNTTVFHSPKAKFFPKDHTGLYYRREGEKNYNYLSYNDNGSPERWTVFIAQEDSTLVNDTYTWLNRKIQASRYVAPRSYDLQGFVGPTSTVYPINLSNVYHSAVFAQLNEDIDYYINYSNRISDTTGTNGDPQINQDQKCHYVAVKNFIPNVNSDLFNSDTIVLKRVNLSDNYSIFYGDCFINFFAFKKLAPKGQTSAPSSTQAQMRGVLFSGFESDINSELRHSTIFANSFYYPKQYIGLQGVFNFVLQSDNNIAYTAGIFADPSEILLRWDNAAQEEFRLNQDYSFVNRTDKSTNYNRFINYCSDCYGLYPNRIIWSPKSQDESVSENWRVNAANDYIDLDATTGEITGLWFDKNRMLVHTTDTTWFMAPNPQQMQLDQTNLYIGTGDFLSIPPEAVQRRNFGYAGVDEPFSVCDTPFGHCWIDAKDGRVFKFYEGVEELSAKGTKNWFRDNLPNVLTNQLAIFGLTYCCVKNNSELGVGVRSVYDPRFRRLIVMKRDFEIINLFAFLGVKPEENPATVIEDNLYYDPANCEFLHWDGEEYQVISFYNQDYFANKSWTISYSFVTQSWTSWHSYMPSYSYSDNMYFYTFNDRQNAYSWKHGTNTFLNFYGTMWPSFIEFVSKGFQTFGVDAIKWVGHTKYWDGINKLWTEDNNYSTFDGMMVYNEEQSSGKVDLALLNQQSSPFGNIGWNPTTKNVVRVADEYRTSGFYNLTNAYPVNSKGWVDIASYFDADGFGNGWIDLVPVNIDTAASQFNMDFVRGKWVATRFWYEPNSPSYGTAINVNSTTTTKTPR